MKEFKKLEKLIKFREIFTPMEVKVIIKRRKNNNRIKYLKYKI